MNRKAIIFGIRGFKLSGSEKIFLKKIKPWGIILFSRNIKNVDQLKNLTSSIRKILKDKNYPILIDQEGGKVSRLNSVFDLSLFSQEYFFNLYLKNKKLFSIYYEKYINNVSYILKEAGININTVPVLDIKRKKTHSIIGNRSFPSSPQITSKMGRMCINFYLKNKIGTVNKHIPGHGLARSDSHHKTPIVNASKKN